MSPREAVTDVAASVRARLLRLAQERGEDFQLVLSDFATERFLYRLGVSRHADRFVLKGAMLLRLWSADRHRATWDVDLLGRRAASAEGVEAAVREICAIACDDGLTFDPDSMVVEEIREAEDYPGVRVRLAWHLARARIPMQIDVAFDEVTVPAPELARYPTLLGHPEPSILAYPRETVVAEKLEAIVSLGPTNSRMKDYYDLWLLASRFEFDAARLQQAIRATFEHRGTPLPDAEPAEITPAYLTEPGRQALWRSFWQRNRPSEPQESVGTMAETLQRFLGPICEALARGRASTAKWPPGGPWR